MRGSDLEIRNSKRRKMKENKKYPYKHKVDYSPGEKDDENKK